MAAVTSSTSSQSTARYTELIRKQLFQWGPLQLPFRDLCDEGKMIAGHSAQYKVNRKKRMQVPLVAATEGTTPTAVAMNLDSVTGTASQYVIVTSFTDVAELEALFDLLALASEEIKDVMERLVDRICSTAFLANTNVVYPSTYTSYASIVAADTLSTDMLRKAVAGLRAGDSLFGGAKEFKEGMFMGVFHPYVELGLQKDPTWEARTVRQGDPLLEKGVVSTWMGVMWKRSNFIPVLTNLAVGMASLTLTDGVAVSDSTAGLNGFTATVAGSGSLGNGNVKVVVTRIDGMRGFEEGVSSTLTIATGGGSKKITFTAPDADATYTYFYNIYASAVGGTTLYKLTSAPVAADDATTILTTDPTTGAAPPTAPDSARAGVSVIPTIITGAGAVCTVDMENVIIQTAGYTPTPSDPATQNRYVSAKVFLGAFLQQSAWSRTIYSAQPTFA